MGKLVTWEIKGWNHVFPAVEATKLSFRKTSFLNQNHVLQTDFFIHPNNMKNAKTRFGNKKPRLGAENGLPNTYLFAMQINS